MNKPPNQDPPTKLNWPETFHIWSLQLLQTLYINGTRWFLYLPLTLTPTLYSPRDWLFFQSLALPTTLIYISNEVHATWTETDSASRCMAWSQKKAAISVSPDVVSGWYGPGAYLAWLITAYTSAISSIWGAKCSPHNLDSMVLDGELLVTLGYPLIATFDILVRLIKCNIDPGLNAAVFVLISSAMIIGPATRLSWQEDGKDPDVSFFPQSVREWAWKSVRFWVLTVLYAVIGEPYAYNSLLLVVYPLLAVVLLYSEIRSTGPWRRYASSNTLYRPRAERVVVFCAVQVIFLIAVVGTGGSVWPVSGTGVWDLDQVGGLLITIAGVGYGRREGLMLGFLRWRRRKGRGLL